MIDNAISPFSRALTYEGPDNSGFLGTPRANQFAQPWGEPFEDAQGNAINPGTQGGPNFKAALQKTKGKWGKRQTKAVQDVGNISWYGKPLSTKPDARKMILSFNGPTSRHFLEEFEYGTTVSHREVYREGGLVGVAPGPVLGASVQSIATGTPPVPTDFLNVVCLYNGQELLMRRPLKGPFYRANFGAQTFTRLSEFKSLINPDGWFTVGQITIPSEYERPRTPWFFNESGTEAQCIRIKEKQGLNRTGGFVPERAGDRFKITVGTSNVSLSPEGNEDPYEFSEKGTSTDLGIFNSPVDIYGFVHSWFEHRFELETTMSGKQVVAVDYIGDDEVLVYAEIDVSYRLTKDYMKGRDELIGSPPGTIQGPFDNRNSYSNPQELGADKLNFSVGDHLANTWYGGYSEMSLTFTVEGVEYVIPLEFTTGQTSDQYDGRPYTPPNRELFYREYIVQYVRFLDVRAGGMFAARIYKFKDFLSQQRKSETESETLDLNFSDNQTEVYLAGTEKWVPSVINYVNPLNNNSASWDEVRAYPSTPWTWTTRSHIGSRPTDNNADEVGKIRFQKWWPDNQPILYNAWYGLKLLYHDKFTTDCAFVHREDGSYIASGVFINHDTQALQEAMKSGPFSAQALTSGTIYHPMGEM